MTEVESGYLPGSAGWIEIKIKVPVCTEGFDELREWLLKFLEAVTPKGRQAPLWDMRIKDVDLDLTLEDESGSS